MRVDTHGALLCITKHHTALCSDEQAAASSSVRWWHRCTWPGWVHGGSDSRREFATVPACTTRSLFASVGNRRWQLLLPISFARAVWQIRPSLARPSANSHQNASTRPAVKRECGEIHGCTGPGTDVHRAVWQPHQKRHDSRQLHFDFNNNYTLQLCKARGVVFCVRACIDLHYSIMQHY